LSPSLKSVESYVKAVRGDVAAGPDQGRARPDAGRLVAEFTSRGLQDIRWAIRKSCRAEKLTANSKSGDALFYRADARRSGAAWTVFEGRFVQPLIPATPKIFACQ